MKTIIYMACAFSSLGIVACSRQEAKTLSPSSTNSVDVRNPYNQRVVGGRTDFINNNLSHIKYEPSKIEQLKVIIQDNNGVELLPNSSLNPNTEYNVIVTNLGEKQVLIKSGDGFKVILYKKIGSKAIFNIKTNDEIPDQLYVSLVPTTNNTSSGAIVKYSPQNFLLPTKK